MFRDSLISRMKELFYSFSIGSKFSRRFNFVCSRQIAKYRELKMYAKITCYTVILPKNRPGPISLFLWNTLNLVYQDPSPLLKCKKSPRLRLFAPPFIRSMRVTWRWMTPVRHQRVIYIVLVTMGSKKCDNNITDAS